MRAVHEATTTRLVASNHAALRSFPGHTRWALLMCGLTSVLCACTGEDPAQVASAPDPSTSAPSPHRAATQTAAPPATPQGGPTNQPSNSPRAQRAAALSSAAAGRAEVPQLPFRALTRAALPTTPKAVGSLERAVGFGHGGHEYAAAFFRDFDAERGNARLQVVLWQLAGGQAPVVLRHLRDHVRDCEFDLFADFIDVAFGLTDLDGDGLPEVTLAYHQTCTSDVSPASLKVVMLEGVDKYVLRGNTRVDVGDDHWVGGDTHPGAEFDREPAFLKHAQRVWKRVVDLPPWGT